MTYARRTIALVIAVMIAAIAGNGAHAQQGSCEGKTAVASGADTYTFEFEGRTRLYRMFVPSGYDAQQPVPLVMTLHGAGGWAAQQEEYSGWNDIAERETFITVHPQGALSAGTGFRWNAGEPMRAANPIMRAFLGRDDNPPDDAAFLAALLAHVQDELCIDAARIYVNGLSNGGGMTHHLACTLSGTIAAAGTVAGAYTPIPDGCESVRPVPMITFHGKLDPIVDYAGNPAIGLQGVESWAADWAARNNCSETPEPIDGLTGAVTGVRYTGCTDGAGVVLYTIADGGHTWPTSEPLLPVLLGKTSTDIDASETMWTFFAAHTHASGR